MRRTKRALIVLALASSATGLLAATDTALLGGTANADTEKVEARNAADVFATPGEQARVVTHVRAGKEMTVLQTKNRWLKVRVNGRTGWITRSNVTALELSEPAPRAKRRRPFVEGRSTRRGSRGKGPGDRIGADVTDADVDDQASDDDDDDDARLKRERKKARIKRKKAQAKEMDEEILDEDADEKLASGEDDDDSKAKDDDDDGDDDADDDDGGDKDDDEDEDKKEPEREYVVVKVASAKIYEEQTTKSDPINTASEGSKLFVVERDGKWIKVEDDEGNAGWVKASKVEDGGGPGYQWEKFAKGAHANLGYASMTQNFTSNGATDPSYKLSSAAAVLAIGGDGLYDYSAKYLIGGDIGYRLQVASPGIRYADDTGNAVNIGYKVHQIDLGVRGGYKLSKTSGMAAYARLGYHYERFGINNVDDFSKNLAYLPSEILQGPTIGASFEMPKLTEKFAVRAGIDYLKFLASRKQTVNLEDGSTSSPTALWLNAGTVYDWKPAWKITGDYQFAYAKTSWSGAVDTSMRPQQATSASRKDSTHTLMIGLGHSF